MAIDYMTPRRIRDPAAPAHVIGKPSTIIVGLRGPTPDEIKASKDNAAGRIIQAPRGVYRYRSHEDANAQMDQWLARSHAQESRVAARRQSQAQSLQHSGEESQPQHAKGATFVAPKPSGKGMLDD